MTVVYSVDEMSELTGCSTWLLYEQVRKETCPFPFVRIGKRVLFPKGPANAILGIEAEAS